MKCWEVLHMLSALRLIVATQGFLAPLLGTWHPPIKQENNPHFTIDEKHIYLKTDSTTVRCSYIELEDCTVNCTEFKVIKSGMIPRPAHIKTFHGLLTHGAQVRVDYMTEHEVNVTWRSGEKQGTALLCRFSPEP
jgi:hypothetical protein